MMMVSPFSVVLVVIALLSTTSPAPSPMLSSVTASPVAAAASHSPATGAGSLSCSICPDGSTMEGGSNPFLITNSTDLPTCQQVEEALPILPDACKGLAELEGLVDVAAMCGCTGYEPPGLCSFCPSGSALINNSTLIDGSVTCAHAYLLTLFILDTSVCPSVDYYLATCCSSNTTSETPNADPSPSVTAPSIQPAVAPSRSGVNVTASPVAEDLLCSICPEGATLDGASNIFLVSPPGELLTCKDVNDAIPSDPDVVCSFLAPLGGFLIVAAMCGCTGSAPANVCTFCPSGSSLINNDTLFNGTITCERFYLLTPFLPDANDCPSDDESVVATCCRSSDTAPTTVSSTLSTSSPSSKTPAPPPTAIVVPTAGSTAPTTTTPKTSGSIMGCLVQYSKFLVVASASWLFW